MFALNSWMSPDIVVSVEEFKTELKESMNSLARFGSGEFFNEVVKSLKRTFYCTFIRHFIGCLYFGNVHKFL